MLTEEEIRAGELDEALGLPRKCCYCGEPIEDPVEGVIIVSRHESIRGIPECPAFKESGMKTNCVPDWRPTLREMIRIYGKHSWWWNRARYSDVLLASPSLRECLLEIRRAISRTSSLMSAIKLAMMARLVSQEAGSSDPTEGEIFSMLEGKITDEDRRLVAHYDMKRSESLLVLEEVRTKLLGADPIRFSHHDLTWKLRSSASFKSKSSWHPNGYSRRLASALSELELGSEKARESGGLSKIEEALLANWGAAEGFVGFLSPSMHARLSKLARRRRKR